MAKRKTRRETRLVKAAAGIGRALGRAMNRMHKVDADVRKVMDARGRNLQQLGRDAGRKIATLGRAGAKAAKRRTKTKTRASVKTKPVRRATARRPRRKKSAA